MKEVYFSEEELGNLDDIGKRLFTKEGDVQSIIENREIIRPEINYLRIVLFTALPVVAFALYIVCLSAYGAIGVRNLLIGALCVAVYVIATFKKAVICAVKLYQRFAPDDVRRRCRFEPSCSQYMILAIEKYGTVKGIYKGIKRLRRCNIHHGGYDFP